MESDPNDYQKFLMLYVKNTHCLNCEKSWRFLLNNDAKWWHYQ